MPPLVPGRSILEAGEQPGPQRRKGVFTSKGLEIKNHQGRFIETHQKEHNALWIRVLYTIVCMSL